MKKSWYFATILTFLVTSCAPTEPSWSSSFSEAQTYSVTLPTGEGYSALGSSTVLGGEDYSFSVTVLEGYDASKLVVANNGVALTSDSSVYTIPDVHQDIVISVSGVTALPSLILSKASYLFFSGQIGEEEKKPAYYLEGVSGSFDGKACSVKVDLSKVNFEQAGEYVITYSLEGHEDIFKKAKIIILSGSVDIQDVTMDIGAIYENEIVSYTSYGELGADFSLAIDGKELTALEAGYDSIHKGNYLKKDYLRSLSLGEHQAIATFGEKIHLPFSVRLLDEMEAKFSFSSSSPDLCFLKDEVRLPDVEQSEDSIQALSYKYLLGEKEMSKEDIQTTIKGTEGDYDYSLVVYKGNEKAGEKKYKIHIRGSYLPFLFASSGGPKAKAGYSNEGNPSLSFNYPDGDTNIFLDENYLAKNNTEKKKYVYIAFRITSMTSAGSIWTRNPETSFDSNGNYIPNTSTYLGGDLNRVGNLVYKTLPLNGNSMETDSWIIRNFVGTIEILKTVFCDLDYKDPIVEQETAKGSLASTPNSFGNVWKYIHVAAEGKSGGASMGGNCMDFQSSFKEDMKKAGYQNATFNIRFKDRADIKKIEPWAYESGAHKTDFDALVTDGVAQISLPLSLFESIGSNRLMLYFNISETSASTYDELRNTSKTYVSSNDFVIESVSYH